MPLKLNSFPKLSNQLRSKTGYIPVSYSFFFDNDDDREELVSEAVSGITSSTVSTTFKLSDPKGIWHPEKNNLILSGICTVNVPSFLFGVNGIVPESGVLGIAVEWTDKEAGIRGSQPVAELTGQNRSPRNIRIMKTFDAGTLRGTLILRTVYYLKSAGFPNRSERHLAGTPGTILGVLDETKIIIDGNGSIFPIVMTDNKDRPLWWVDCSWGDPLSDPFNSDSFCLYINTGSKAYRYFGDEKSITQSPLFLEIVCSALQILIMTVLNDEGSAAQTIKGQSISEGSVSAVVHYLINTFELETDQHKPGVLAEQLRIKLGERMGF